MNEKKREYHRDYMRRYREEKPEKVKAAVEKSRDYRSEYMKRYRAENPGKVLEARERHYVKFLQARGYTVIAPQEGEAK